MLSESHQRALLNAVPSFEPVWHAWLADHAEYVSRFPEEKLSAADHSRELLWHLATHLGARVATGDVGEAEWLFAALEGVYEAASEEVIADLTVGFLEGLIIAIEGAGGDATILTHVKKGSAATWGWRTAYEYLHPPNDA